MSSIAFDAAVEVVPSLPKVLIGRVAVARSIFVIGLSASNSPDRGLLLA